jgi:hypothetical protein
MNAKYRRGLAIIYQHMASYVFKSGDKQGGIETEHKALALFEALAKEDAQNAKARRELALAYNNLGDLLWYSDDIKGATESYRLGMTLREELLKADPTNMQARRDLALSYGNYGYTLAQAGDAQGLELYRKNIEIVEGLLAANPDNANSLRDVAVTYSYCGDIYGLLAAKTDLPKAKRIEYYQSAISFNERSIQIWMDMRNRGILQSSDKDTADKISKSNADYKMEIAKLSAARKP